MEVIGPAGRAQSWGAVSPRTRKRRKKAAPIDTEWKGALRLLKSPRFLIIAGLVFSYIWRFHDLAPVLRPFRVAAISTVLCWGFLVVQPRLGHLGRVSRYPYVLLYLLWSGWMLVATPFALNPERATSFLIDDHGKTFTMFLFLLVSVRSMLAVRALMVMHVFGAAVLAFFHAKSGFALWRSPVPMYDVNDMALMLNVALPITLWIGMTTKSGLLKTVAWGVAILLATSVLMTRSRGGLLAMAMVLLFLVALIKVRWWMRLIPVALLAVGFLYLPADTKERLGTLLTPSEDYNMTEDQGRVAIWKRGLTYLQTDLYFGVGPQNFPEAELTLNPLNATGREALPIVAHNSFLQALVEGGVLGGLLYAGMFFAAAWRLWEIRNRLRRLRTSGVAADLALLAEFLLLAILGYASGAFFLSMAYSPMLPSLLGLVAGVEVVAANYRNHLRRQHRSSLASSGQPVGV